MKWYIQGDAYACCSCNLGCPCATGGMETTGSDGCSAVQIMNISAGNIDGIDVSGTKVAGVVDWPGPMMSGNGIGRLYFDLETSLQQREALKALIDGKLGGVFARMLELVPKTLAPILAPFRQTEGEEITSIIVGDFGEARIKPMRSPNGEAPRLHGAGGFRDDVALASGTGSWWRDPELRHWAGGGYAERNAFDWHG